MDTNLEYIKHNRVRIEGSKRGYENFKEFFENIKRTVRYTILENIEDDKELLF